MKKVTVTYSDNSETVEHLSGTDEQIHRMYWPGTWFAPYGKKVQVIDCKIQERGA